MSITKDYKHVKYIISYTLRILNYIPFKVIYEIKWYILKESVR